MRWHSTAINSKNWTPLLVEDIYNMNVCLIFSPMLRIIWKKSERSLSKLNNPVPVHDKKISYNYTAIANFTKPTPSVPPAPKCYVTSLPSVIRADTLLWVPPHVITVFWLPTAFFFQKYS